MTGPQQHQQQDQQQRRSVYFAEDRNETYEFDKVYDTAETKQNLFYTAAEFALIKSQMRREASRMKRAGLVQRLLEDCFDPNSAVAQDMLNAFTTQLPDDDDDDDEEENYGRGLERYLSRRFAQERTEIKDFCLFTVLTKQRKLRRMGLKYYANNADNDDEMSESIAADYREQCQQARLFARRIAIADELAVYGNSASNSEHGTAAAAAGTKRHYSSSDSLSSTESDSLSSDNDSLSMGASCQSPPASKIPRCPSSPVSAVEEFAQMAMDMDME